MIKGGKRHRVLGQGSRHTTQPLSGMLGMIPGMAGTRLPGMTPPMIGGKKNSLGKGLIGGESLGKGLIGGEKKALKKGLIGGKKKCLGKGLSLIGESRRAIPLPKMKVMMAPAPMTTLGEGTFWKEKP